MDTPSNNPQTMIPHMHTLVEHISTLVHTHFVKVYILGAVLSGIGSFITKYSAWVGSIATIIGAAILLLTFLHKADQLFVLWYDRYMNWTRKKRRAKSIRKHKESNSSNG